MSLLVGEILGYGGASAPGDYLLCDGASYLRADYPELFAVIGTTYGAADGTHFNVPDIKGKTIFGYKSTDTDFDALGKTGGAKTANLQHTHTQNAHTHAVSGTTNAGGSLGAYGGADSTAATNHTHTFSFTSGASTDSGMDNQLSATQSILNAYCVINFIIRYKVTPTSPGFLINLL